MELGNINLVSRREGKKGLLRKYWWNGKNIFEVVYEPFMQNTVLKYDKDLGVTFCKIFCNLCAGEEPFIIISPS